MTKSFKSGFSPAIHADVGILQGMVPEGFLPIFVTFLAEQEVE